MMKVLRFILMCVCFTMIAQALAIANRAMKMHEDVVVAVLNGTAGYLLIIMLLGIPYLIGKSHNASKSSGADVTTPTTKVSTQWHEDVESISTQSVVINKQRLINRFLLGGTAVVGIYFVVSTFGSNNEYYPSETAFSECVVKNMKGQQKIVYGSVRQMCRGQNPQPYVAKHATVEWVQADSDNTVRFLVGGLETIEQLYSVRVELSKHSCDETTDDIERYLHYKEIEAEAVRGTNYAEYRTKGKHGYKCGKIAGATVSVFKPPL